MNKLFRITTAIIAVCVFNGEVIAQPEQEMAVTDVVQADVKEPLYGLISMGDIAFHKIDGGVPNNSLKYIYAKPGILDGVVLNFTWAQLEPKVNTLNTDVIEKALAKVRAYNEKYPNRPLAVRLRVYAGPNAPGWAKAIGGKPVKIQYRGENLTIGRFWSEAYGKAWRVFQGQLAEKYDSEPLIRSVAMTSCSSVTSEPFVFAGGAKSLKSMQASGLTDGKYRKCLMRAPDDYLAWLNTRVEFPFNPFRYSDSGNPRPATEATVKIMSMWRKQLGKSGVLSNHTLQSPAPADMIKIYDAMKDIGPPIELQAKAPTGLDWDATFQYGVAIGATAIEIWPETFIRLPSQKLKMWVKKIKKNQTL